MNLSKIEEKIFANEKAALEEKLANIGQQLINVFAEYPALQGEHKNALKSYIAEVIISAHEGYFGGYTTRAAIESNLDAMPDGLKSAILETAVSRFMKKVDSLQDIVGE